MREEDLLKLETRKKIYDFIFNHPGLHFGKISRELNIPKTTLNYHLKHLIKKEMIIKQKEGRYQRFFTSHKVSNHDKNILNLFRQETPRNIILYLLVNVAVTQIELSENLEKHPTTIEFHLKKLVRLNLLNSFKAENGKIVVPRSKTNKVIEYKTKSNEIVYKLKSPIELYEILTTYKKSFFKDKKIIATIDIIEDAIESKFLENVPNKTNKDLYNDKDFIEIFLNFFPLHFRA